MSVGQGGQGGQGCCLWPLCRCAFAVHSRAGGRYDVGAKEFKPVAAKDVRSASLYFRPLVHDPSPPQVGPTTLAVRLLPQVTAAFTPPPAPPPPCPSLSPSHCAVCATHHSIPFLNHFIPLLTHLPQFYDKRFRAAALE